MTGVVVRVPKSDGTDEPLSVGDLDRMLKRAVEGVSAGAWVQGEVGAVKIAASGHAYFTLKDENEDAVIDAVAYRDAALRSRRYLLEGTRVVVRGKATIWAPRGKLQLVVEAVRPAGRGALLEALERLKQRLTAEGLFASDRKKRVPSDARVVGVVTSATGAVIHDIVRVAFRRGAVRIILSPTVVQGEEAPASIVAALDLIERVRGLDVIIIGRGGGSFEDLMPFNDELVVRRVAACKVPVVSAVGHEVDVTLTDLAADARASTPSQAAELVVADREAQIGTLAQLQVRLRRAMHARLVEDRALLERWVRRMGDPRVRIAERQQQVDDLTARLEASIRTSVNRRAALLDRWERRLVASHPRTVLARTQAQVDALTARMTASVRARVTQESSRLRNHESRLQALSPLAVLARGYAVATGQDGRALVDSNDVVVGAHVTVRLLRGRLHTVVEGTMGDSSLFGQERATRSQ